MHLTHGIVSVREWNLQGEKRYEFHAMQLGRAVACICLR